MIYDNLIKNLNNKKNIENIFDISFVDGAKISISGHLNKEYEVLFIDAKTNDLIYKSNIKNNMWSAASPKYFINWKLQIKNNGRIVEEKILSLQNKKVKILLDTKCLGDILAYVGSVIEFKKQHSCIIDCIILNEQLKESISEANPDINFYSNDIQGDYYACYKISYRLENWQNHIPINPKLLSLTQIAPTILDLPKKEYKIKLSYTKDSKPEKPYICIASQSTAQAKYWNNESGWEKLIKYLNKRGYDVWCIDKFSTYGNPKRKMNFIPKGAIDKTGDLPIKERMSQISNAEFFIGLGSGLSWLAWNIGVPVVLISGFSEKWAEFETPYRIINENVCHGCWNKEQHTFDRSDWMWCPENKNFECTRSITPEMVIQKIEPIMKINTYNLFENFDWGDSSENFKFLIKKEFLEKNVYKKIFDVESGDIVIDLGASIGPFIKSILKNNPSKCYAVEALSKYIPVLNNNIGADNVKIFNHALPIDNEKFIEIEWERTKERVKCVPFSKFLSENYISKIDFLKCDCEGGEYDVFKLENMAILEKISKIVTEFHIDEKLKNKFRFVRDELLPRFKKYYAYNINGEEVTQSLSNEELLNYCRHIIIHIDNRN